MSKLSDLEKGPLPEDSDLSIQQEDILAEKDEENQIDYKSPNVSQGFSDYTTRSSATSSHTIQPAQNEEPRDEESMSPEVQQSVSSDLNVVPRSERRGFLARLALLPEVRNPYMYGRGTKWTITFLIALAAMVAPAGSSILFPALPEMAIELNVTPTITNLTVALYMLSMSIFPLWWSAFSERLGRRTIYIVSFAMSAVFSVLCAISNSIGMLIVMRMLAGGASASVQAVGAGTVADIWEVHERGKAMGVFYMGPLLGPLLAPIFGGLLSQKFGWRSTQWFLVIYASCLLVILTFCLPETLRDKTPATLPTHNTEQVLNEKHQASRPELTRVSTRQSVQKLTKTYSTHAYQIFIEPLTVLKYLRFPAVALTVYYASITFGSLYFLNISVQQSFALPPYSFSPSIIGLLYLPNSVGYFICSIFGGKWSDNIMAREARAANRYRPDGSLIYNPEDRMRENAWLAAAIYPAALIAYGWSVDRGVHWSVPLIANFFFGVGSMLVFSCATTMLTEFMPGRSSSGVAVNNFVRNLFSCTGAIVASPLIYAIGNGWVFTILGLVCLFSSATVYIMRKNCNKWREEMDRKLNAE